MRILRVLVWLFFLIPIRSFSQDTTQVAEPSGFSLSDSIMHDQLPIIIGDITLYGNRRTKGFIVRRELPFHKGSKLIQGKLPEELEKAREQVMNTLLFVDVTVSVASKMGNVVNIRVDLKERWYFFPLPYFRLVDRNFNQWWVDQH
ncbi:MAG: hypothetical protein KGO92_13290, partial [Bacteroidota bacterium]|nr:hypothetical protein [Bacteroidota bacterium]